MKYSRVVKYCIVIGAIVIASVFSYKHFVRSNAPASENFGVVKRNDLIQRVTISGQLWPRKRLDIKPPFSGYVEKIYVKIGDRVKAGAPLVTFSPSLGKGETNYPFRSSFDGVVTQILKGEGEYVTETGDQNLILRVEDLSELYVLAKSPELDIAKLKVGQEAKIRISSLIGESFVGTISEIALSAIDKEKWGGSSSTEFQLRVLLKSHDPRLFPGMSALMDIITNKASKVLSLPHEYIQEDEGSYFVTTSKGERKNVELGLQTEEGAEIIEGVSEGDLIKVIDFLNLPKIMD